MLLISSLCRQSQQHQKNRSSAPLKNQVGHTMLVGSVIVKLVGLIGHSQLVGSIDCLFSFLQGYGGVFFSVLGLSQYKPGRKSTGKKNPCNLAKPQARVKGPAVCKPRVIFCLIVGLSLYKPSRKSTGKKNLAIISQNIPARRIACWDRPLRERERETLEYQNTSICKLCSPALIFWRVVWDRPLSEREREKCLSIEMHFFV